MEQKKRRNSISLKDKLAILKELEDGKIVKDICTKYKVHKSTISRIKGNKENLEEYASKTYVNQKKIKRMKTTKYEEVDDRVYAWFLEQRQINDLVSNESIKLKALEVNKLINGSPEFVASDGWLTKFKNRHGIRILTVCGERMSCNVELADLFKYKFRNIIAENSFLPDQIYNCDETGLVYKSLHNKTNVANFEKNAVGTKVFKERVTIMPCTNATGTHKLDLMMIGKSKSPRCFHNMELPLYYKSSKNAWQTYTLFKDWYHDVFIPQVTKHLQSKGLPIKALLLIDNASCHGSESNFTDNSNFKVMFFPPNNTPLLQPLDQHVIKSLKQRYRKHLLTTLAALGTEGGIVSALKTINLKDVVYFIVQAWNEIPISVIQNSFKHLFSSTDEIQHSIPADHFVEEDDIPLARLYNSILTASNLTDNEVMEWANGTKETTASFDIATNHELVEGQNERTAVDEHEQNVDNSTNINDVINSFNLVIEWAVESDLPFNEILTLQRIREKAIIKKYSQ